MIQSSMVTAQAEDTTFTNESIKVQTLYVICQCYEHMNECKSMQQHTQSLLQLRCEI